MLERFEFTPAAEREFEKLEHNLQKRITEKLNFYLASRQPLYFAKPLVDLRPATHRFRIGSYRVLFYVSGKVMVVTLIDKREDAYRRK